MPDRIASALLDGAAADIRHGFYGRRGGADADFAGARIFTNQQAHSRRARVIDADSDPAEVFAGDGLVARAPGVALGVLTADCAPVLLADPARRVIGAAHAGWRGALAGVTDAVVAAMVELGARPGGILCAIGPAIQRDSYQVGAELAAQFSAESPVDCGDCFFRGDGADDGGGYYFDLPEYVRRRLAAAGVGEVEVLPRDTAADEARFFSHRRSCRRGENDGGRQLSVIALG